MADLADRLTEIYGATVATSAATILDRIYAGDLDIARRRIDALGPDGDGPLARMHMLSILHLANAEFEDAENCLSICVDRRRPASTGVDRRPDIFLEEYCELMLDLDRQSKATEKFDQLVRQGKATEVLDALATLMAVGTAWAHLWERRMKLLDAHGRHEDALRVSLESEDRRLLAIADSLTKLGPKPVAPEIEPDLCRILYSERAYLPSLTGTVSETLTRRITVWSQDDASLEQIDRD